MGRTELDHIHADMFYEAITDIMGRYYELIYGNYVSLLEPHIIHLSLSI